MTTPRGLYAGTPPAGTSVLYTAAVTPTVVLNVLITNKTGGAAQASLILHTGDGDIYLLNAKSVPANDVYPLRAIIGMEGGDALSFVNPAGSPFDVYISGIDPHLAAGVIP